MVIRKCLLTCSSILRPLIARLRHLAWADCACLAVCWVSGLCHVMASTRVNLGFSAGTENWICCWKMGQRRSRGKALALSAGCLWVRPNSMGTAGDADWIAVGAALRKFAPHRDADVGGIAAGALTEWATNKTCAHCFTIVWYSPANSKRGHGQSHATALSSDAYHSCAVTQLRGAGTALSNTCWSVCYETTRVY